MIKLKTIENANKTDNATTAELLDDESVDFVA